jgi:hypothetical protein
MDAITLLRQQLKENHEWLDATMQGLTSDQLHWKPTGKANSIAASYAHVTLSEDAVVNVMLKDGAPMMATSWAGKTGASELPPPDDKWFDWSRRVKVDIDAMRKYAHAVYANTDTYIASLKDSDLSRMAKGPAGERPVLAFLNILVGHVRDFTGEISAVKGLQGLKGYPA